MKKDKHITVNLTEEEHSKLIQLAEQQERTPAALCRLLINKQLKNEEAE